MLPSGCEMARHFNLKLQTFKECLGGEQTAPKGSIFSKKKLILYTC
jgi:hypothetical protein